MPLSFPQKSNFDYLSVYKGLIITHKSNDRFVVLDYAFNEVKLINLDKDRTNLSFAKINTVSYETLNKEFKLY